MEISLDSIVDAIKSLDVSMVVTTAIVGAISGWIAAYILQGKGLGVFGNMIVGILGAFVGKFLFDKLDVTIATGTINLNDIVTAVVGAMVLLLILRIVKKK